MGTGSEGNGGRAHRRGPGARRDRRGGRGRNKSDSPESSPDKQKEKASKGGNGSPVRARLVR